MILLAILMAFAWAIGGEKYFGKWRRGVLVAAVSVVMGIGMHLPLLWLIALAAMFYLYQLLSYDKAIGMIWDNHNPAGWVILFLNGAICGAYPALINGARGDWVGALFSVVAAGVGFCLACWLSNGLKWSWNGCYRVKDVGVWCPGDAWWWACWIYGLILGALSII